jgi:hypothetical protein
MKIHFRCDPALVEILPRPIAAARGLPEWLRDMSPKGPSELHGREIRTVKQCPPFVDAMSYGFLILLPCDVDVDRGVFTWDWKIPSPLVEGHPRAPLSFHVPEQTKGTPLSDGSSSSLKFNSFWTIELEPGWSLYASHPANREDLPFRLLTGLVDSDRFVDAGINFPAVWMRPDFVGRLPKGMPVAQCFPVPRIRPELEFSTLDGDHANRYTEMVARVLADPGIYRKQYRSPRDGS